MPVLTFFLMQRVSFKTNCFRYFVVPYSSWNDDVKKATLHIFENRDKPLNTQNKYSLESQYHATIARRLFLITTNCKIYWTLILQIIAAWAIKDRGTFHGLVKKVDSLRYVSETKTSKNYIDFRNFFAGKIA